VEGDGCFCRFAGRFRPGTLGAFAPWQRLAHNRVRAFRRGRTRDRASGRWNRPGFGFAGV